MTCRLSVFYFLWLESGIIFAYFSCPDFHCSGRCGGRQLFIAGIIVWSEDDANLFWCLWVGRVVLFLFFQTCNMYFFLKSIVLFSDATSYFQALTQNHMGAAMQVKKIHSRSPQGSQSFWWIDVLFLVVAVVVVAGCYGYSLKKSLNFKVLV